MLLYHRGAPGLRSAGEQVARPTGEGFTPGNGAPDVKSAPKGQPVRVIKIGRNDLPCGSGLKWKSATVPSTTPTELKTPQNRN